MTPVAVTVLWKPDRAPSKAGATHDVACAWVNGCQDAKPGHDLGYREVPASAVPADVPRCSYCGGGR